MSECRRTPATPERRLVGQTEKAKRSPAAAGLERAKARGYTESMRCAEKLRVRRAPSPLNVTMGDHGASWRTMMHS